MLCVPFGFAARVYVASVGAAGVASTVEALRAHPGKLERLIGIQLGDCDAKLPLELRGASNSAILDYYRDMQSGPLVVARRCRVMLLGNGGVGKTTLAQRVVTGRPPKASTGPTYGVMQREVAL